MFNKKADLTGSKFKEPWPQSDKVVLDSIVLSLIHQTGDDESNLG